MLCEINYSDPGAVPGVSTNYGDEIGLTVIKRQRLYPVLYHRYRAIL